MIIGGEIKKALETIQNDIDNMFKEQEKKDKLLELYREQCYHIIAKLTLQSKR